MSRSFFFQSGDVRHILKTDVHNEIEVCLGESMVHADEVIHFDFACFMKMKQPTHRVGMSPAARGEGSHIQDQEPCTTSHSTTSEDRLN